MTLEEINKNELAIDKIIDESLIDYLRELNESDIENSTDMTMQSFLDETFETYSNKSTIFINQNFPDVEKINVNAAIQNEVNNNLRAILYRYAGKRSNEFIAIQTQFIDKLNLNK